jgi:ATP-dependent 26S proteasome regulatory subunit
MIPINDPERNLRADVTPIEIDQSVDWDQVGGLDQHINALKEMVMFPLMYPELFERFSVTPPKGVLFYGPPGTILLRPFSLSCFSSCISFFHF